MPDFEAHESSYDHQHKKVRIQFSSFDGQAKFIQPI